VRKYYPDVLLPVVVPKNTHVWFGVRAAADGSLLQHGRMLLIDDHCEICSARDELVRECRCHRRGDD
jgi:hypothetical protein